MSKTDEVRHCDTIILGQRERISEAQIVRGAGVHELVRLGRAFADFACWFPIRKLKKLKILVERVTKLRNYEDKDFSVSRKVNS